MRKWARWITMGVFALLYIPLIAVVIFSFRDPLGGGLTLEWYRRVFSRTEVIEAIQMSLWVGFWSTCASTAIGTAAAFGLRRASESSKRWVQALIQLPLVTPEIVMGLSLLMWFSFLRLTLGSFSIILSHVTFSISYVVLAVVARLEGFEPALEEAAKDLGASPWQVFQHVTLPLIRPGVVSGALMAFTLSFDDFLISFFTAGAGSETLPIRIYSMIRFGISPEIHALSSAMLGATLVLVLAVMNPFRGRDSSLQKF